MPSPPPPGSAESTWLNIPEGIKPSDSSPGPEGQMLFEIDDELLQDVFGRFYDGTGPGPQTGSGFRTISKEIMMAAADMWRHSQGDPGSFSLSAFPPTLKEELKVFDKKGDGMLDKADIVAAARMYDASRKEQRNLKIIVVVLAVVIVLLLSGVFALSYFAAELSKEMRAISSGVIMTSKGTKAATATVKESLPLLSLPSVKESSKLRETTTVHIARKRDINPSVEGSKRLIAEDGVSHYRVASVFQHTGTNKTAMLTPNGTTDDTPAATPTDTSCECNCPVCPVTSTDTSTHSTTTSSTSTATTAPAPACNGNWVDITTTTGENIRVCDDGAVTIDGEPVDVDTENSDVTVDVPTEECSPGNLASFWMDHLDNSTDLENEEKREVCRTGNEWFYDGIKLYVGTGQWYDSCDSSMHHCSGGDTYGYAANQVASVATAIRNGAVYPGYPKLILSENLFNL